MTTLDVQPTRSDTVSILVGAKTLVVQNGWVREKFRSLDGYCLEGAVRETATGDFNNSDASREAERVLLQAVAARGHITNRVSFWNDAMCTGIDDAVALIDEALLMLAPSTPPVVEHINLFSRARQLIGV